jgi:hypothetical protein
MYKFTDAQEKVIRFWGGSWLCYITDPYRHDNIEADEEQTHEEKCDEAETNYMNDLINYILKDCPELKGKEEEIENFIREY